MFAEWVSHGAEIGVTAFFAISVFLMCCAVIFGLMALVGNFIKAGSGDNDVDRH